MWKAILQELYLKDDTVQKGEIKCEIISHIYAFDDFKSVSWKNVSTWLEKHYRKTLLKKLLKKLETLKLTF